MPLFIEDTPRNNLTSWTSEARAQDVVRGAVLSTFASPRVATSFKPGASRAAEQLRDAGCEVWLDAATHALDMPGAGDFRYYDGWGVWDGARNRLLSGGQQRDHVLRVFDIQQSLGAPFLGPTVLLTGPAGAQLSLAYGLADIAREAASDAFLTIAGTGTFWAGADDLDAFVGALAELGAPGFFLVVVRPTSDLPVAATPAEVAGLCRTVRSLAQYSEVNVSHGDLAGLPAVAAGARSLGTGWDTRQRVCSFASYESRDASGAGGGWFTRPTFRGLLGLTSRAEAERLASQAQGLSELIHPGPLHPAAPKEVFMHHASCLAGVVSAMQSLAFEERFQFLLARYEEARTYWSAAQGAASLSLSADAWIDPLIEGLRLYGQTEGWV